MSNFLPTFSSLDLLQYNMLYSAISMSFVTVDTLYKKTLVMLFGLHDRNSLTQIMNHFSEF